jgi:hypothetical protein
MIFKKLFPSPGFWLLMLLSIAGCKGRSAGYSIILRLSGHPMVDSVRLIRYEGTNTIGLQTLKIIPEGTCFSGLKPLQAGMYSIKLSDKGKIDFLLSDTLHQDFEISADISDLPNSLKFENSPENKAYHEYNLFLDRSTHKQAELLKQQFPGSTLSLLLKVMSEPKISEPVVPVMITNREQYIREYYFKYLTGHYFDSIDFSDPRIISFPVYEITLRFYLQRVIGPVPEMTEPAIETVMGKAGADPDVYRFTAKFLFRMFRESASPKSMENAVYVAENFILNDPGKWKDDSFIGQVREKVSKATLNPVGKVAADLKLVRSSGELIRLSDVRARKTIRNVKPASP